MPPTLVLRWNQLDILTEIEYIVMTEQKIGIVGDGIANAGHASVSIRFGAARAESQQASLTKSIGYTRHSMLQRDVALRMPNMCLCILYSECRQSSSRLDYVLFWFCGVGMHVTFLRRHNAHAIDFRLRPYFQAERDFEKLAESMWLSLSLL